MTNLIVCVIISTLRDVTYPHTSSLQSNAENVELQSAETPSMYAENIKYKHIYFMSTDSFQNGIVRCLIYE